MRKYLFHIHGDNIVECNRAFAYIATALSDLVLDCTGPHQSATCPVYSLTLKGRILNFQFLPGYGSNRWNQDIAAIVKEAGGRLRESADALITIKGKKKETPLVAIEFCGALDAGNQSWQRHGRALSFSYAKIPYFFVTEVGAVELDSNRNPKARRLPNPAVAFSFFTATEYGNSVCLPVYEASPGATDTTKGDFGAVFGSEDFLQYLRHAILNSMKSKICQAISKNGLPAINALSDKSAEFAMLLSDSKKRTDGFSRNDWKLAKESIQKGENLADFLSALEQIPWKKTSSIPLTAAAKSFMALGAGNSFGVTSGNLPLSFVPKDNRADFSRLARKIYSDMSPEFSTWLASGERHLCIAWILGFKHGGDDARPDRGLTPMARMLVGDDCDLMAFVYGPAPQNHWNQLDSNPAKLVQQNGLWESVLAISDAVLADGKNKPTGTHRGYLALQGIVAPSSKKHPLNVKPVVMSASEQDVDTAIHLALKSFGNTIFEGMCNPPGGDWSGISFKGSKLGHEYRWLSLPRVSGKNSKRPDHVFSIFRQGKFPICLCIESKERASSLEGNIGSRLKNYVRSLFRYAPSAERRNDKSPWSVYNGQWQAPQILPVSAGAYLADGNNPFGSVKPNTNLDILIGVEFTDENRQCVLHIKAKNSTGRNLLSHIRQLKFSSKLMEIKFH